MQEVRHLAVAQAFGNLFLTQAEDGQQFFGQGLAHFFLQLTKAAALLFQTATQRAAADVQFAGDDFHIRQPTRGAQQPVTNLSSQAAAYLPFRQ